MKKELEFHNFRRNLSTHLKNLIGWTTSRKLVVFAVDDYGNIRVASKKARLNLINSGLNLDNNRFDKYDTLETAEDLSALFDVLTSVKDKNNRAAVFTPFSLSANINFKKMLNSDFETYYFEKLPETFSRLPDYSGTWNLWQEGMYNGIFLPQFHGREHLNIRFLLELGKNRDFSVLKCLEEESWAALNSPSFQNISYVSAFSFEDKCEINKLVEVANDGLNLFEEVFGYRATVFTAPGESAHSLIETSMVDNGIRFVQNPSIKREHQGAGRFKNEINYQGKNLAKNLKVQLRNAVFEPSMNNGWDWVELVMKEIEVAFRWNKPAIISSHRVNFCGSIDETVRNNGLAQLKQLLKKITKRWPDVEFVDAAKLGEIMLKNE